jgi:hypothetical protein
LGATSGFQVVATDQPVGVGLGTVRPLVPGVVIVMAVSLSPSLVMALRISAKIRTL